jgi:hypothetical protein
LDYLEGAVGGGSTILEPKTECTDPSRVHTGIAGAIWSAGWIGGGVLENIRGIGGIGNSTGAVRHGQIYNLGHAHLTGSGARRVAGQVLHEDSCQGKAKNPGSWATPCFIDVLSAFDVLSGFHIVLLREIGMLITVHDASTTG